MDTPMLHIEIDKDGVPRTLTKGVKVKMIVQKYLFANEDPVEIAQHYGISLADVHAAFAYYYDNKQAMDADFEEKEALLQKIGISGEELKRRIRSRSQP